MDKVILNITNRCNFRCKTCIRKSRSSEDLSLGNLKKLLHQAQKMGVNKVVLTGGEPILHPRFESILKTIQKSQMSFGIVTNGWLHEKYAEHLKFRKEDVRFMAVSLDGHTSRINDSNRKKGSFDRALDAVNNFLSMGLPVRISHIVNKHNLGHLTKFMSLWRNKKVLVNIGKVIATGSNEDELLSKDQTVILRTQLKTLKLAYRNKIMVTTSTGASSDLLFCPQFATLGSLTLRFDGKVVFCCDALRDSFDAVLGDIATEELSQIVPRSGRVIGQVLSERISSMINGKFQQDNDCDFCIDVLNKRSKH